MQAILLAAGSATRFGSQKLLQPLPDGRLVVEAAVDHLHAAGQDVLAVASTDPRLGRVLAARGCRVVINERPADGMGSSLALGVRASEAADGWLVALGDMPFVRAITIAGVAALAPARGIALPVLGSMRGHPVAFTVRFGEALMKLHGDQGARAVLLAHADCVSEFATDDPGVIADIDVPADLDQACDHRR